MKILVIEALGLHLGYLGCYGNDWVATPNLDRIAAEGIVFDAHIVDQPELRAETAWEKRGVGTGCYALPGMTPPECKTARPRVARVESLTSFAAEARGAKHSCPAGQTGKSGPTEAGWVWIEGPSLLPPWQIQTDMLDAYFDEDDVAEGLAPWADPPLEVATLTDADVVCLQNTYAAAVTVFDAQLGALFERMPLDDTLLCVTARSGLPLGEHGMIGAPQPRLHDELVHVPLLMRLPRAAHAGSRIAALTQPIDLLPTFLETLGQAAQAMHGRSLWPLIRGEIEEIRPYAMSAMRVGAEEGRLLRTQMAALHLPIALPDGVSRLPQLFLKPEDRWEVNDLYHQQLERAEAMEKTLREVADSLPVEAG